MPNFDVQDTPNVLDVRHITCGYANTQVLTDVSLAIPAGFVASVIGANGAGKTTLLRAIAGLVNLRSGSITLGQEPLDAIAPHSRARMGLGHVPEGRHLFADMTVRDNLLCGASQLRGRAGRMATASRLEFVCDLFPILGEHQKRRAAELSGGQQQMLAIGRALMAQPRLLLLDEPTTGLAPVAVGALAEALTDLRTTGVAMLLVEQAVDFALQLADDVHILREGRVVASSSSSAYKLDGGLARLWREYSGDSTFEEPTTMGVSI